MPPKTSTPVWSADRMLRRICLIAGCLALPLPGLAGPVIGQWCDPVLPGNASLNRLITLTDEEGDIVHARSSFANGSRFTQTLEPAPGQMLVDRQAPGGEAFRINGLSLEMHDSSGHLKTLQPMPYGVDPQSCFGGS